MCSENSCWSESGRASEEVTRSRRRGVRCMERVLLAETAWVEFDLWGWGRRNNAKRAA